MKRTFSPHLDVWMRRALEIAEHGRGSVEPNPVVGAVVLDRNGSFVSEGWHKAYGGSHAEVNALQLAGENAIDGTLFVTLEPCCHYGNTPPCTEAIIQSGIGHVVLATRDPDNRVDGCGMAALRAAGVNVTEGVCAADALLLNAPYLKLATTGRPWIHAKWAMSLDGKIATRSGDSKWITGTESRRNAHALRARLDSIVVGRGTVIADNPKLTARPAGARNAARVVLSPSGDLPDDCHLLATARDIPVIVYCESRAQRKLSRWRDAGAEVVPIDDKPLLDSMFDDMGRRKMSHVLVEGGAKLLGAVIDAGHADEFHVFISQSVIGGADAPSAVAGNGVSRLSDALRLAHASSQVVGEDFYVHGFAPRYA